MLQISLKIFGGEGAAPAVEEAGGSISAGESWVAREEEEVWTSAVCDGVVAALLLVAAGNSDGGSWSWFGAVPCSSAPTGKINQ